MNRTRSLRAPLLAIVASSVAAAGGCGGGEAAAPASSEDAGAEDAQPVGPLVTVTTHAPSAVAPHGVAVSATWAAVRGDDAAWVRLEPSAIGTYAFPAPRARWAIAIACADADGRAATVQIHRRGAATTALDVDLDDPCLPPAGPEAFAIGGTIANLSPATSWLDFGYAGDTRGAVLTPAGGRAAYEEVGIEAGEWDMIFGVRDDSFGPLTRVGVVRGVRVAGDVKLDLDLAGPDWFTPDARSVMIRGVGPAETLTPSIVYAAGGTHGLAVGPQDPSVTPPDVALAYVTLPRERARPDDRYHGEIVAEGSGGDARRVLRPSFHDPVDLDLTLPPPLGEIGVTVEGSLLRARFSAIPNAATYEIVAEADGGRRSRHAWRVSMDDAVLGGAPEVSELFPDLSAVSGFDPSWSLATDARVRVTATATERRAALGDGTLERATSRTVRYLP